MEKECFGVIDAFKVYRQYLLEREFEVFTDHYFLTWLLARIKEHSGRLWRWVEKLREFQCKVYHIAGRKNIVADALTLSQTKCWLQMLLDMMAWAILEPSRLLAGVKEDFFLAARASGHREVMQELFAVPEKETSGYCKKNLTANNHQ